MKYRGATLAVLVVWALAYVALTGHARAAESACETLPEGFIICELPAAQRPFMDPLPLDCAIPREDEYSFTLRCRINMGQEPKWVPGPKPVVNLPKPKPAKKLKKRKKR